MTQLTLGAIAAAFAGGLKRADARLPQARSTRSERIYQPGIGPHSEPAAVALVMQELAATDPARFGRYALGVPYPALRRQRCDLVIPDDDQPWAIEVKLARFRGDNGRPADEALMHLISPYEGDRSALTDCAKLARSGLPGRLAVLIYGFDHPDKPLDPAIEAFEALARLRVDLGERHEAPFAGLVHPVHREGRVFAWEIGRQPPQRVSGRPQPPAPCSSNSFLSLPDRVGL